MWDDQKRKRFNALREPDRHLSPAEQSELAALVKELEDMEAAYLKPATERLRQERLATEKQNARLTEIVKRKKAFVERLDRFLIEADAERRAIDDELALVLANSSTSTEAE